MIPLTNGAPVVKGIKGFVAIPIEERFWQKMGFDSNTVRPNGNNQRCFTAEEVTAK
jgi:hypothetical protein